MPRMNDTRRGELLRARVLEYESAGLGNHRNAAFARDMIARSEIGKSFTAGQRRWATSIIEEPLPIAKDPERHAAILAAAAVEGLKPGSRGVLKDFAIKIFNGWNLSEKQEAFLERLLAEAVNVAEHGPWCPSEDQVAKIRHCVQLAKRYDDNYLYSHGGLHKAITKAILFLKAGATVEMATKYDFDEWCMDKLLKQFKTPLAEIANPKHMPTEMRWAPIRDVIPQSAWQSTYKTTWHLSMVVDAPVVDDKGQVAYPMIVGGTFTNVPSFEIKKRQPKS